MLTVTKIQGLEGARKSEVAYTNDGCFSIRSVSRPQ